MSRTRLAFCRNDTMILPGTLLYCRNRAAAAFLADASSFAPLVPAYIFFYIYGVCIKETHDVLSA